MPDIVEVAKSQLLAYNEKNWDKARSSMKDNVVYDEKGTGRRLEGAAAVLEAWQGWAKAIPDSQATFVGTCTSGNTVVLEIVWRGKQSGPLQTPGGTIPPSNKTIELPACQVVTVEGNRVARVNHYFDMLTLLTQIGAAPKP